MDPNLYLLLSMLAPEIRDLADCDPPSYYLLGSMARSGKIRTVLCKNKRYVLKRDVPEIAELTGNRVTASRKKAYLANIASQASVATQFVTAGATSELRTSASAA